MKALIGAVLIIAACGSTGFLYAAEKRQRTLCAEGYLELIRYISERLPCLTPMDAIIKEFDNSALENAGVLRILRGEHSIEPCNKRFLRAIELQKDDTELYSVLLPLANELGSLEYGRQMRSLKTAEVRLDILCGKRRAALEGGEKCYRWLGVLAGAMAVILLL